MGENDEKTKVDLQNVIDAVDFNKVAEITGVEQLKMVEGAKLMQLQLEYLMHLFECMFEMQSVFHLNRFGNKGDNGYETIYRRYFPMGRSHYAAQIKALEKNIAESSKPTPATAPAPAPVVSQ